MKETLRYRWIEAVPLRDGKDALLVNWIGFEIVDAKGKVKYSMAWVTSLPVSKDNVAEIVACGRARWKIENESFNVLKNHGYELEHNFGHGQKFLAMTLAALNLLAFAWHTVLELLEPPWQAAREAAVRNQLLRPHPHVERLRNLSLLAGFPPIPRHLLDPAKPHKSRRQPVNLKRFLLLELLQPVERIFGKESPHLQTAEVNGVTPGGVRALLRKMRRVMCEEAAFGPEVVVHHFEKNHQSEAMRRVDQRLEVVWRAIRRMRRIGQHAVIASSDRRERR